MSTSTKAELHSLPGVAARPDAATAGTRLNHCMLRVKDAEKSLDFYTRVLGMTLLNKLDFADMKFSLLFLGFVDAAEVPDDPVERLRWMLGREGVLELTHNHGTESDPGFGGYSSGNSDPGKGFGHTAICVRSVAAACARFDALGVAFVKRPDEGKMRDVAFLQDPDGYWVEVLEVGVAEQLVNWNSAQA